MQKTTIIGNIGRNAEVRVIDGGATAISFSVACTEKRKDQDYTTWYSCTIWRQAGQPIKIADYLVKGQKVYCEGKPGVRAFLKGDGTANASLELRVDYVELLGGATQQQPSHEAAGLKPDWYAPESQANAVTNNQPAAPAPTNDGVDDLPF